MSEQISLLLVEDQEITRLGLKLTLEKIPSFKIVGEAEEGDDAVRQALELKPDVILMDIGLAEVDGISAARRIKEAEPNIRILMFTSHESDDDIFAALAAGADGYALKTIPTSQLILAITTIVDGAGWLDPGIAGRVLRACASASSMSSRSGTEKFSLSPRELEVLSLVVEGRSNQEIADKLVLSLDTVKTHMRHIMEKLSVSDRTQAAVKAMRQGLV